MKYRYDISVGVIFAFFLLALLHLLQYTNSYFLHYAKVNYTT